MEVKIGVSDSPRELVFTSSQTAAEVEELVTSALSKAGSDVLSLSDDKGRRFLVHTAKISYVEIGVSDVRRVGFGIGAGPGCDGQVLVWQDAFGLRTGRMPRFVRQYADLHGVLLQAARDYVGGAAAGATASGDSSRLTSLQLELERERDAAARLKTRLEERLDITLPPSPPVNVSPGRAEPLPAAFVARIRRDLDGDHALYERARELSRGR